MRQIRSQPPAFHRYIPPQGAVASIFRIGLSHRFRAAVHPDLAAHDSFHAVVNFTAHDAVVNSKCHGPFLPDFTVGRHTISLAGLPRSESYPALAKRGTKNY
jgi:hypothetical protein